MDNIGKAGTSFAGTLFYRTSYYASDFVLAISTDTRSTLHLLHQAGTNVNLVRTSSLTILINFGSGISYPTGNLTYE